MKRQANEAVTVEEAIGALESEGVKKNLEAAISRLQKQFSEEHAKLLQSYVAAVIVFKNAQRPCVITNMTMQEYRRRKSIGDTVVISVVDHNTSAQGPADVAFKKDHYLVLKHYVRLVREHVEAETDELEERLFLTMSGNEYTRVKAQLMWPLKKTTILY